MMYSIGGGAWALSYYLPINPQLIPIVFATALLYLNNGSKYEIRLTSDRRKKREERRYLIWKRMKNNKVISASDS
jgi:hypothetical protein